MAEPLFIDIHSHLNFASYDEDRGEVIQRALDNDTWMINVGTQKDTSKAAVELAGKYEKGVYATVGLHPVHSDKSYHDTQELGEGGKEFTSRGESFDIDFYRPLAKSPKVLAIGECGLDFYRIKNHELGIKAEETEKIIEKQKKAFRQQIELALEVDKPLMIHCREAYSEAFEILNSYFKIHNSKLRGDLHFFAGSIHEAKPFLDLGFSFSFTGVITFTKDYDEIVKYIPLERMMSETDCPYVTPAPYRGKRNEPVYVQEVVKKIALIKGLELEKVREQLLQNAQNFFKFPEA